jgi:hypothetical protein
MTQPDHRRFHNKPSASLAMLLIVVLSCLWFGGIVQHYCLDGIEPGITLHFENLNEHVEHSINSGHVDFEKDPLANNLLPKNFENGIALFSLFLLLISLLTPSIKQYRLFLFYADTSPFLNIRPPLRAPPTFS